MCQRFERRSSLPTTKYRSKATLWGLPLAHLAFGVDPATGGRRVAKGILAVGDQAWGVVALGGRAQGVVAFGGISVGLLAVGGLTCGLISVGGLALGLLAAIGGVAAAALALGGCVAGYLAWGGLALGVHAAGGNVHDPVAIQLMQRWGGAWIYVVMTALVLVPSLFLPLAATLARRYAQRHGSPAAPGPAGPARTASAPPVISGGLATDDPATAEARRAVRGPAIGLIVTALLNWLALFVVAPLMGYLSTRQHGPPVPGLAVWAAPILMIGSGLILWGALKMERLQSLRFCRVVSVLAMIIGPGSLVGWPVGIGALVTLGRPEVKAAFARSSERLGLLHR